MSLTVVSRPVKTIESITSRWVSSQLPIVYEMIRKDRSFASLTSSGGKIRLLGFGSSFTVGDLCYLYTPSGPYNQIVTVESVFISGSGPVFDTITFEEPYLGSASGWLQFITARPLYRINVGVYLESDDSLIATLDYSPIMTGEVNIDVTSVVNSQLDAQLDFTFTDAVQINTANNKGFYIKYTEVWTGSAQAESDDAANYFFAVLGKMKIKENNVPNLFDYSVDVPFKLLKRTSSTEIEKNSVAYLSFINNEVQTLTLRIEKYIGDDLDSTVDEAYPSLAVGLYDVQIPAEANTNITSIVVSIVDAFGSTDVALTDSHEFILSEICNPLKFLWRNSLGGLEEFTATDDQIIESSISGNEKVHRLKFIAEDINTEKWLALDELNSESDVYKENIVTVSEDTYRTKVKVDQQVYMIGDETLGVVVIPNQAERRTRHVKNEIEIEIEYPRL